MTSGASSFAWAFSITSLMLVGACQGSESLVCASGRTCPTGSICDDILDACFLPGQRAACDGVDDAASCTVAGFAGAPGLCRDGVCYLAGCGDSFVLGSESCDGENLGAASDCTDLGFQMSAPLSCNPDCTYNQSACIGYCGDGLVSGAEFCDGDDLNEQDCSDLGFYNPQGLACNPAACVFDTTNCTGFCGDGEVSGGESCDDTLLDGKDCTDLGFYNPDGLACNSACGFNAAGCTGFCGDEVLSGGESCDGALLGDSDCTDLGFYNPEGLACNTACGFATSACTGFCGDGLVTDGESCDGVDLDGQDCTDLGFYNPAGLSCSNACVLNFGLCSGRCGDGVTDLDFFENCDNGSANSNLPDAACRINCQARRCGDGILDVASGENCDDGNPFPGDGCSGQCILEVCGNGVVDLEAVGNGFLPSEDCDDGENGRNHDGCAAECEGETPRWSLDTFQAPTPGENHAMVFDAARNRVVLFGGRGNGAPRNDTWEWDGVRWTQVQTANAPSGRYQHGMIFDSRRGRVVLWGGSQGQGGGPVQDTWSFDGTDWTELPVTQNPTERIRPAMAYDSARDRIVLFGGRGRFRGAPLDDTWEFDGSTWTQMSPATVPPARYRHKMAYDPSRGRVVLFGGGRADGTGDGPRNDTWEWDGSDWTPMTPATLPPPRRGFTLAYDASRRSVLLFGGQVSWRVSGALLADTWEWDGSDWAELTPVSSPQARQYSAMAYDAFRSKMVLFGGSNRTDTWEWDGSDWSEKLPPPTPPARSGHALAYDASRGKVVLFGGRIAGRSGPVQNDTWEFDGLTWTQMAPATVPPARYRGVMAYDSARRKVVLFGGSSANRTIPRPDRLFSDTWEWDGSNWSQITTGTSPGPRTKHAMAYDASRERVLLVGGFGPGRNPRYEDTWEYDGTNWTERTPTIPVSTRHRHAMAYDAFRRVVVLFGGGGGNNGGPSNETWEWDGSNWAQIATLSAPNPRRSHIMAYDAVRRRVLLFGGDTRQGGVLGDSWEWDGTTWRLLGGVGPAARHQTAMVYDTLRSNMVLFGGTVGGNRNSNASEDRSDTAKFQFSAGIRESCTTGYDGDNDGLLGCVDPDCWGYCTPECPPDTTPDWPSDCSTAAGVQRCGDGTCDIGVENSRICPSDCSAATPVCGDFICDPAENIGDCPGDCTPAP